MSELAYLLERAQEMRMYVAFALFGVTHHYTSRLFVCHLRPMRVGLAHRSN